MRVTQIKIHEMHGRQTLTGTHRLTNTHTPYDVLPITVAESKDIPCQVIAPLYLPALRLGFHNEFSLHYNVIYVCGHFEHCHGNSPSQRKTRQINKHVTIVSVK